MVLVLYLRIKKGDQGGNLPDILGADSACLRTHVRVIQYSQHNMLRLKSIITYSFLLHFHKES